MSLTLTLTKKLPIFGAKKLMKQLVSRDNRQCLAVLIDREGQILGKDKLVKREVGFNAYIERIESLIKASGFEGKLGETTIDFALSSEKKSPLPILLVGVGDSKKLTTKSLEKIAGSIYQNSYKQINTLTIALGDAFDESQCHIFSLALLNNSYHFDKYKSDPSTYTLSKVALLTNSINQTTLDYAIAVHQGQSFARNMANEPGNICFPEYLAEQARALARTYPDLLDVTVLGEKKMAQLGMNCFLSVSRGSAREGQLVIMKYKGKSDFSNHTATAIEDTINKNIQAVTDKLPSKMDSRLSKLIKDKVVPAVSVTKPSATTDAPIVLVGKGVTFDSGGISIKPGAAMDEMKFDMGGAASVIGTIKALCESRLPINVVGALACAENMPSSDATRPGDIVTAMNGKTVEILNTDAEGRLVLADTLCYVQRFKPRAIIDVATLTGACVIALGHVRSALYSNNDSVLSALEQASEQSGDLIWQMPLDDDYQTQLDSPIADIQNIGGRPAGSITAACFLSRFIEEGQAWAHLDIAGTAWKSGKEKAGTGRPVPLFMQYLKNMSAM